MATLDPKVSEGIGFENPVSVPTPPNTTGAGVGAALSGLSGFLNASARRSSSSGSGKPSYTEEKDARQQANLIGLQDAMLKSNAVEEQKGANAAQTYRRQVLLNYQRAGGDTSAQEYKDALQLTTGMPAGMVGMSVEEYAANQQRETPEYATAVLAAKVALPADASQEDIDAYALQSIGEKAVVARSLQDQNFNWVRGQGQAKVNYLIDDFMMTTIGGLKAAEESGQPISLQDYQQAKLLWGRQKQQVLSVLPADEKLRKPIMDRMSAIDEIFGTFEGMVGVTGASNLLMSDLSLAAFQMVQEGDLTTFEGSAFLESMKSDPVGALKDWGVTTADRFKEVIQGADKLAKARRRVGSSAPLDIMPVIEEDLADMDAAEVLDTARKATTIAATSKDDNAVLENLTLAFAGMKSVSDKNKRFSSADDINKVFDGSILKTIRDYSQRHPEYGAELTEGAIQALGAQQVVATQVLDSMLAKHSFVVDGQGQIKHTNETFKQFQNYFPDATEVLQTFVDRHYDGSLIDMARDKGARGLNSDNPVDQRAVWLLNSSDEGRVFRLDIVKNWETINTQNKIVNTLKQKRGEFIVLQGEIIRGGENQPQVQGGEGNDNLGEPRISSRGQVDAGDVTTSLIAEFEGFSTTPYWDVNAYRVGFGSDTITKADGTVVKVEKGMTVSKADAARDLARRSKEFANTAIRQIGEGAWNSYGPEAQAALTSITYNYGSLPKRILEAAKSGDTEALATAVEGLAGDNDGINRKRRMKEAAIIRGDEGVNTANLANMRPHMREDRTPTRPQIRPDDLVTPEVTAGSAGGAATVATQGGAGVTPTDSVSVSQQPAQAVSEGNAQPSEQATQRAQQEYSQLAAETQAMLVRLFGTEEAAVQAIATNEIDGGDLK